MKSIQKNLSSYTAQIKQKQREADRIDREIDNIIKSAIAASNKKAGKASTVETYALTPAGSALAKDFESNKGKLDWPVDRGIVSLRYGTQPSPINKTLMIKSNGVRISTLKSTKVKAVFNGEVFAVAQIKNANIYIVIRHGNYFTIYKNLGKVYVKNGDKVTTNQDIGEVFTNPSNGESILNFSVSKNGNYQNPAHWIYEMK
jgi:septal ring factor EnvC (AmiA/AmiB activator)